MCTAGGTVAPGDEHQLCTQTLRSEGSAPIPAYSDTMAVLMDSWNYENLLPPLEGAVWAQAVENIDFHPDNIAVTIILYIILYMNNSKMQFQ